MYPNNWMCRVQGYKKIKIIPTLHPWKSAWTIQDSVKESGGTIFGSLPANFTFVSPHSQTVASSKRVIYQTGATTIHIYILKSLQNLQNATTCSVAAPSDTPSQVTQRRTRHTECGMTEKRNSHSTDKSWVLKAYCPCEHVPPATHIRHHSTQHTDNIHTVFILLSRPRSWSRDPGRNPSLETSILVLVETMVMVLVWKPQSWS